MEKQHCISLVEFSIHTGREQRKLTDENPVFKCTLRNIQQRLSNKNHKTRTISVRPDHKEFTSVTLGIPVGIITRSSLRRSQRSRLELSRRLFLCHYSSTLFAKHCYQGQNAVFKKLQRLCIYPSFFSHLVPP